MQIQNKPRTLAARAVMLESQTEYYYLNAIDLLDQFRMNYQPDPVGRRIYIKHKKEDFIFDADGSKWYSTDGRFEGFGMMRLLTMLKIIGD
jgi:hypothetical protein